MRVRTLDSSGDMTFGQGSSNFLANSPAMVAQIVRTRLALWQNEWFLDLTEGMPWLSKVLGAHSINQYDQAITARILGSPGVVSIENYSSALDPVSRKLAVTVSVNTQFGSSNLSISLAIPG